MGQVARLTIKTNEGLPAQMQICQAERMISLQAAVTGDGATGIRSWAQPWAVATSAAAPRKVPCGRPSS